MASVTSIAAPGPAAASTAAPAAAGIIDIGDPTKMPDHDVSFSDVLSVLNPLQYIPIVGSIYRAVTGDTVPQAAQVLGGALLGGPLGLVASAANAVLEQSTGKDAEQHVVAMLFPQGDVPPAGPQNKRYAAATPSTSPTSETAAAAEPAPVPSAASASPPAANLATATAPETAPSSAPPATTANAPTSQPATAALPRPPAGALPPTAAASAAMAMAGPGGAVRPAGAGYTLADYRTFAGTGMAPPPNGNAQRTAFVPLQTTLPLPNDVTRSPVVAAAVRTPEGVAPAPATTAAATQPQDTWISQAMMRGLDRYRDMMRQQDQQQGQKQDQPGS